MDELNLVLGTISGGKILDVATGEGSFIPFMTQHLKDFSEVIGIDRDQEMIDKANGLNKDNRISFQRMSGDHLEFEDNYFDTVSVSNALHHMNEIDQTLQEMLRVLKPGGTFLINELFCDDLNEKQLTQALFHHLQSDIDTALGICHNKTFHKEEIEEIVMKLELQNLKSVIHQNEKFNQNVDPEEFSIKYIGLVKKMEHSEEYEKYSFVLEKLIQRLHKTGIEFAPQVLFVGNKA